MKNKNTIVWTIAALVIIGGAILLFNKENPKIADTSVPTTTVSEPTSEVTVGVTTQDPVVPVDTTEVTTATEPSFPETGFPPRE